MGIRSEKSKFGQIAVIAVKARGEEEEEEEARDRQNVFGSILLYPLN